VLISRNGERIQKVWFHRIGLKIYEIAQDKGSATLLYGVG
jgi:hypothetical protein